MGIMRETDERFINLEKKLGLFVLIAAAGVILLVVFIGLRQDIFISKSRLYLISDSGKDLAEGMAVKLSGVKIGRLKKLDLDDITEVKLELSIYEEYIKWIKKDSYAMLVKEGLIGESIIEIIPGSGEAMPVEEGEYLALGRERGLGEMAQEVSGEIKLLTDEIKKTIYYVNDPESDIRSTLKNINRLSGDILVTRDNVDKLIASLDIRLSGTMTNADNAIAAASSRIEELKGVVGEFEAALGAAKLTLERVERIAAGAEGDYPGLISRIDRSLENVEKITEELRRVTVESAPHIPAAIKRGSAIMDDTKEIVGSVKKTWPISSNIEEPREEMLKIDSYE